MRTKVTLTLLLLNVALFYWIFVYEGVNQPSGPIGDAVMPPEATAVIDRLEIRRTGAAPIVLEQRPDGWFLGAPRDWPANRNAVEQIIDELRRLRHKTSWEVANLGKTGAKLADYGLETPPLVLAFGHNGQLSELKIGIVTTNDHNFYALPPPGTWVHVIDRGLADVLPANPDALRSATLVEIPVFEAKALVVQPKGRERVRVGLQGDRWQLENPVEARAAKPAVELVLHQLGALRANGFVEARAADPRTTGLEDPAFRLAVEGTKRRQVLLLGQPANPTVPPDGTTLLYGKLENRADVFTVAVDNGLLATLGRAQEQLRDTHLLEVNPAQLRALEVKAPGQPDVVLQRLETGTWQALARQGAELSRAEPADAAIIERLLAQLAKLEAAGYQTDVPSAVDLENWGFRLPERTVQLTQADGSSTTLLIGSVVKRDTVTLRYARTSASPTVYLIPNDFLDELPASALSCRQRLLRDLPSGARITGLALKRLADGGTVFARQLGAEEKWETKLGADPAPVRDAALALLGQLRQLRAREFSRGRFEAAKGAGPEAKPWLFELTATIELSTSGEQARTSTSTLVFTERVGGTTMYVGSAEFDCVYLAPQELLDAVFGLTFGDRDPGPPAPVGDNAPLTGATTPVPPAEKPAGS